MIKLMAVSAMCVFMAYQLGTVNGVKKCGTESQWYNTSSPSAATNFTEREEAPRGPELDSVCGGNAGGVLKAHCRDKNGEPFKGVKNESKSLFYYAECTAGNGLTCTPYDNHNTSCPDFAIQYYCDCSDVVLTTDASTTDSSTAPTTVQNIQQSTTSLNAAIIGTNTQQTGSNASGASLNAAITGTSTQQTGSDASGASSTTASSGSNQSAGSAGRRRNKQCAGNDGARAVFDMIVLLFSLLCTIYIP